MITPEEFLAAQVMKGNVLAPPYPAVALRVQELLADPSFTMGELSQLVASDPALAFRVIALANSAANRPASGPVGGIDIAVARIGVAQVSELALAAALADGACNEGPLMHLRYLAWRRSLASAFVAQEIAGLRGVRKGEGFLVGLLRDFGLAICLATLEPAIVSGKVASELPPVVVLGAASRFQSEVSRRIADKWNLPEPYRKALTEDCSQATGVSELGRVGYDGSRVAHLVETYPAVTDKLLMSVLQDATECRRILAFLPLLPESIAALGPQPQPSSKAGGAVLNPSSPSRGSQRRPPEQPKSVSGVPSGGPAMTVAIRKGSETMNGFLREVCAESAVLVAPKPLPINWITHLTLDLEGQSASFWVRVERCSTEAGRAVMSVAPYGFDASAHGHWSRLIQRLKATG